MRLSAVAAPLLAAILAACASHGSLVPRESTRDDARARLGAPTETRSERSGDEVWDYAGGAEGHQAWRVRFGPDGKVKEVTQLLTEERLMSLEPGRTTRQAVRELLGRPSEEMTTAAGETWSWRYLVNGLAGHLIVSFRPDGIVRDRGVLVDMINSDPAD